MSVLLIRRFISYFFWIDAIASSCKQLRDSCRCFKELTGATSGRDNDDSLWRCELCMPSSFFLLRVDEWIGVVKSSSSLTSAKADGFLNEPLRMLCWNEVPRVLDWNDEYRFASYCGTGVAEVLGSVSSDDKSTVTIGCVRGFRLKPLEYFEEAKINFRLIQDSITIRLIYSYKLGSANKASCCIAVLSWDCGFARWPTPWVCSFVNCCRLSRNKRSSEWLKVASHAQLTRYRLAPKTERRCGGETSPLLNPFCVCLCPVIGTRAGHFFDGFAVEKTWGPDENL